MSEITETIILDANQKFSSQYLGGNKKTNSLFTNKLGNGVDVKAGDQISLYNSFISEIGSSSDSIEFNDSFLERRNITSTVLTPQLFINGSNDKPLGYQRVSASNITSEYVVKQNKIKISTNYYKNANGENYFALPRRFLTENASLASTSWAGADSVSNGLPYRNGNQESELYPYFNNNLLQFFWCSDDRIQYVLPNTDSTYNSVKMVNDNSRYMIFIAAETRYGFQTDNTLIPQLMHYNKQTAADYEYMEYIENIELDLNIGFNAPSTISDKLTERLREQQEPQINYYHDNASSWQAGNRYGGDIPMSLELNSNTYKTFWSSGLRIGDKDTWAAWNTAVGENYGNNFDYIETFDPDAIGSATVIIGGLNDDFFINGITGSDDPVQIAGGNYFAQSGTGLGPTGGFNSLALPASTNRYMKYYGNNARKLITKNINLLLKNPGKITLYYIQGNSANGGENPDNGEDLVLRLLNEDRTVYITYVISSGSDSYIGSLFTRYEHTLTLDESANSHFIEIAQTTSSQGTFDNYGVKFLQYESLNDPKDTEGSNNYLSQFQYIGVKRPDLFIEGRKFARYFKTEPEYHLTQGIINLQTQIPYTSPSQSDLEYALWMDNFLLPKQTGDLNASGQPYHQIVFTILWSDLDKQILLKNIFNKQENYPELFRNEQNQIGGGNHAYTNVNNSRFIHMNTRTETERRLYINHNCLGWDYQSGSSGLLNASDNINLNTCPIFFDYQPNYKDNIEGGDSWEEGYRFGVFRKFAVNKIDYVSITTGKMYENLSPQNASQASIPNPFFDLNNASLSKIDNKTNFGWDINFNAFGNNIIGLTDGYLKENYDKRSFNEMNPLYENASQVENYKYVNKVYLGADQPSIEYNSTTQRFQISQLHSAERVQNNYNADEALKPVGGVADSIPEFETQGDTVYKINKRLMNTNFTPAMRPYNTNQYNVGIGTPSVDFEVFALNPNMKPWTIFDQLSGIVIKDFGVSEENWENSMWGILGFTYEQFNTPASSTNDLTSRVGNLNKNTLPYAFTNSNVNSKQTMDFTTNAFGAGIYTQQIPITQSFNGVYPENASYWTGFQAQTYPSISETAESVVLSAPNLPRRIRNGFYCIRSDIISNSNYIGGPDSGWLYPILGVVDKVNDTADFWVGGPSSLTYTFTQNKTISEITTSITNPDQSLATIDSGTTIMYKLIRFLPNNFDIVGQIMNEENNNNKK